MRIGVPKEVHEGERRVATTPEVVGRLLKLGYEVSVERGAGEAASFTDAAYEAAGAQVVDAETVWSSADIVLKVRAPEEHPGLGRPELELTRTGQTLISFMAPAQSPELLEALAAKGVNALAMESVPRISRAQKMDALSSMANIAGYRAVIEAAQHFGRFFTGQITAAGRVPPAKVLVIGAGVAGLSAIGAARSLGAIVRAFDTRPEVKDQVESLDADFLDLDFEEEGSGVGGYAKVMSPAFIEAEMALFAEQAKDVDIIITTALIPGKQAPELITEDMVKSMKRGSVIVDLAAGQGGNYRGSVADQVVERHGVSVIGYTDLPSRLPAQSSQLYATNLRHLLTDMTPDKDGQLKIDFEDEVVRGATVVKDGQVTWPPPAPTLSAAPAVQQQALPATPDAETDSDKSPFGPVVAGALGLAAILALGAVAPASFMTHFTVFVLACFVGYMVIWNVSAALHTPLMSVTNAISSIVILGAVLQISSSEQFIVILATATVFLTSINIVGGFAVTHRMLDMFRR